MGSQLASESCLQFYPTDSLETYRILGVLASRQSIKRDLDNTFKEEYGVEKHKKLFDDYMELEKQRRYLDFSSIRYESLLKENRYDLINKYIEMNLGFDNGIVVSDLFAGKGEWLKLFKQLSSTNILIGNELEDGRYFKNVIIVDEFSEMDKIENVLNNDYPMYIFYINDADCENELAEFKSDDIEYVCKSYSYEVKEK